MPLLTENAQYLQSKVTVGKLVLHKAEDFSDSVPAAVCVFLFFLFCEAVPSEYLGGGTLKGVASIPAT